MFNMLFTFIVTKQIALNFYLVIYLLFVELQETKQELTGEINQLKKELNAQRQRGYQQGRGKCKCSHCCWRKIVGGRLGKVLNIKNIHQLFLTRFHNLTETTACSDT